MQHTNAQTKPVRNSSGLPKEERLKFIAAAAALCELGFKAEVFDAILDSRYYGSSVFIPVTEGDTRFKWNVIEAGDQTFVQPVGFIGNRQPSGQWHLHSGMAPTDAAAFVERLKTIASSLSGPVLDATKGAFSPLDAIEQQGATRQRPRMAA